MVTGLAIFVLGSIGAGFAWSMPSMILFRLVQGVGAGAILPVSLTIIADLYPPQERGKVQGWLASVWACSAVIGPLAGGLIVARFGWAWIFWINVPLGLAAIAGFIAYLKEAVTGARRHIDVLGAVLFTIAVSALMLALTNGPEDVTAGIWVLVGVFLVSTALFIWQERRAPDPMVSLSLWSLQPIAAANVAALITGIAMTALTTFLPMYVQTVLQRSPVVAGLALTMLMVGWPIGATSAARAYPRIELRPLMLMGCLLIPLGGLVFLVMGPGSTALIAGIGSLVMGLGMGLVSVSSLLLIQAAVGINQRASATASNIFARNLGSTLGAAVLGAVLNYGLAHGPAAGELTATKLQQFFLTRSAGQLSGDAIRTALHLALHATFAGMFAITVIILVVPVMLAWRVRTKSA
jgi:MFS family permease